jgi:predicted nucleic acid-binding protein
MTRIAIDARTAVRLVEEQVAVPARHQLVAPTLLRSQVLQLLYRDARTGARTEADARALLDGVTGLRIRLLGDRVSRAVAWRIATQLGWADTADAEYVAVAQLQADVLVTADPGLARQLAGLVETAPFSLLTGGEGA